MARNVITRVPEEVVTDVQTAFYVKMSLMDSIAYLAANKNYGDNVEYLLALEKEKAEKFAHFSQKFDAMCAEYAPGIPNDNLRLDFSSGELYTEE